MMKKMMLTVLVAAACGAVQAQNTNLADMKDDLRIMTDIIEKSFDVKRSSFPRRSRAKSSELTPRDLRASYLQGQGVIFRLSVDRGFENHFFGSLSLTASSDVPLTPGSFSSSYSYSSLAPLSDEQREAFAETQELAVALAESAVIAGDEIAEIIDQIPDSPSSELRAEMEALREERAAALSEFRAEVGALQKELRAAGAEAEVREERRQAIERIRKDLGASEEEYQAKIEDLKTERLAEWETKLGSFEDKLLDVLCARGGNLRSLPGEESVTVIIEQVYRSEDGEDQDKIYIFKKNDLLACRDGSMDKETLKSRSQIYRF